MPMSIIAGIGASAGGIEALQAFFEALPADTGVAFVVVVHLSPEHRSMLPAIIAARTTMAVEQVTSAVAGPPSTCSSVHSPNSTATDSASSSPEEAPMGR